MTVFIVCVAQGIQIQYISDTHTKGSSPDKDFCHYRPTNTNIHTLIIQQSNKPNTNPIDKVKHQTGGQYA